jgi:2-keto-4-pentenoate hydratase
MIKESAVEAEDVAARHERIAGRFVEARRQATGFDAYPGEVPTSLEDAYRIQDFAIALQGQPVGGWKLGRINAPFDSQFGANRLAGPIFVSTIVESVEGSVAAMPVIGGGFAAVEAEFLLRLGSSPDPDKGEWTMEEARGLIDRVAFGIEIASSPLTAINGLGPAVTASDFGNNHGLLVGPELAGWRSADLDAIPVTMLVNGEEVGAATTATMLDGPWGAVRFLASLSASRNVPLSKGQWISTGAVTGVHQVSVGDSVEATFGRERLRCRIVAATSADRDRRS